MTWISELALEALWEEVELDFKPGLVCLHSQGSHDDMDIKTFHKSIVALAPHFRQYEEIGTKHKGSFRELFEALRREGQKAEKSMFQATGGVNTHKGANFIHALLIGAVSYVVEKDIPFCQLKASLMQMTGHLVEDFEALHKKKELTHGEKIFKQYQHMGIRQEAIDGFPLLFDYPFSRIDESALSRYRFLFHSMQHLFDTTIVHRKGLEGLCWAQEQARSMDPSTIKEDFGRINQDFVSRWISPGGSADFLGAAIFIYKVRKQLHC